MPNKDYYDSLGVAREASADDIQRAYRKLARKFHPDVNQTAGAEDRFKEISEAYEVLKDPEKRKMYDRFGPGFASGGPPPGGPGGPPPGFENIRFEFGGDGGEGFGSFFENFFGGGGGAGVPFGDTGRGRPPSRGRDHEARIVLTLEEAAAGGSREVTLTDPMTGRSRTHKVKMPAGVRPGQKIRLAGGGGEDAGGGKAGDLYLTVEIKPHARLRLEGKDLYATVPVTPWEAALGGKVKVPTLDGQVTVKVPAGASTGRKIRLRGKGFPNQRKGHGDLYAEIKIVVPSELTERERALFEELARVSKFRPR